MALTANGKRKKKEDRVCVCARAQILTPDQILDPTLCAFIILPTTGLPEYVGFLHF